MHFVMLLLAAPGFRLALARSEYGRVGNHVFALSDAIWVAETGRILDSFIDSLTEEEIDEMNADGGTAMKSPCPFSYFAGRKTSNFGTESDMLFPKPVSHF
jgi:hypothetical protein